MAILASVDVPASQTRIYRVVRGVVVGQIYMCNRSSTATTIDIWFVPKDDTPGDDNQVFSNLALGGDKTTLLEADDLRLAPGETIFATAALATITMQVQSNP